MAKVADTDGEAAALDHGRWLFAQQCRFVMGVAKHEQLPDQSVVEVAFAGRSNVGKSSLINALTGHHALARTSRTPGRTREINFFDLGGRLTVVDLPGYGYARAAKTDVANWTRLMFDYLRGRATLRRVCLLVDARHGLKGSDREVMTMLDTAAVSYQVVLTKADKISDGALEAVRQRLGDELKSHTAAHPDHLVTSARTGAGIEAVRAALGALAPAETVVYTEAQ